MPQRFVHLNENLPSDSIFYENYIGAITFWNIRSWV